MMVMCGTENAQINQIPQSYVSTSTPTRCHVDRNLQKWPVSSKLVVPHCIVNRLYSLKLVENSLYLTQCSLPKIQKMTLSFLHFQKVTGFCLQHRYNCRINIFSIQSLTATLNCILAFSGIWFDNSLGQEALTIEPCVASLRNLTALSAQRPCHRRYLPDGMQSLKSIYMQCKQEQETRPKLNTSQISTYHIFNRTTHNQVKCRFRISTANLLFW